MKPGSLEQKIDAGLKRIDADIRERLVVFDGGPELLSWCDAHRHHEDEPYIGCPLCHDQFVPLAEVERLREALGFYAEKKNYAWEVVYGGGENAEPGEGVGSRWTSECPVAEDYGSLARAALSPPDEEERE